MKKSETPRVGAAGYRLGQLVASKFGVLVIVAVFVFAVLAFAGWLDSRARANDVAKAAADAARLVAAKQKRMAITAEERAEVRKKMREALSKKDYFIVSELGAPWQWADDPEMREMYQAAVAARREEERVESLAAEQRAAKAEIAGRKQKGVSIGMTRERVLQSSWGRPDKVNTTTYAHGTHEQWVYNTGYVRGYLYFENGILVTIQN